MTEHLQSRRAQESRRAQRRSQTSAVTWTSRIAALVVPVVVATLALLHPGFSVSHLDLSDGSVWITNSSAMRVGRFNAQIQELNGGIAATQPRFDVAQEGDRVLVHQGAEVVKVDPVLVSAGPPLAVPPDASVSLAGGVVAVIDNADGRVWARTFEGLDTLRIDLDKPDVVLGPGGRAIAATSSSVFAVAADGTVTRLRPGVQSAGVVETYQLEARAEARVDEVTAVGDVLVALGGGWVRTATMATKVSDLGAELRLQQAGGAADAVLLAARDQLVEVSLARGSQHSWPSGGDGTPIAPVRVGSCSHGAWTTPAANYLVVCDGKADAARSLVGLDIAQSLVFRVNRSVVVINSVADGLVWVPQEQDDPVSSSWADIVPSQNEEAQESTTVTEEIATIDAECTPGAAGPKAVDDSYGVRPGRTQVLSVIDNDSASSCGILVISEFTPVSEDFGVLTPIYGGRALQFTAAATATGSQTFTYTITDGRGETPPSTATVTLTARAPGENSPPTQVRVGTFVVEQSGQASYHALSDFADPDGDELALIAVTTEDAAGTLTYRGDGTITYRATSDELGQRHLTVAVSDGTATVEGSVTVEVRPAATLAPSIDPIQVVTYVDTPVTLSPLTAVHSPRDDLPRLAGVDPVAGAEVVSNIEAGTFTFTAALERTYYVSFLVVVGSQQVTGVARIDVRTRATEPQAPIAVLDVAYLLPGRTLTVHPLDNDVDPDGGVLVLQDAQAPPESGLNVAIVARESLIITATRTLEAPVTLIYTVSNGHASSHGYVRVIPVPAPPGGRPPVVTNIEVDVRTGGVVTIPALEHASDPAGEELSLVPDLAESVPAGEGLLFVSANTLRYQAPATALTTRAVFIVTNASGARASGLVTIRVHAADAATKAPPRPRDLTARVYDGESVRIPIPLVGIDADGDGVSLLGIDRAPGKGRVVTQGADYLIYEAYPGESGFDTFTYAVEDWVGSRATATVRVGIAARTATAAVVVAQDDLVTLRPGQVSQVNVLANDIDGMGGELSLAPELETDGSIEASVEGRRIRVTAPSAAGTYVIGYSAVNDRGGRAGAVLRVVVDPNAPILPPIAKDVVVPALETIGKTSVDVDVLAVAVNPSGRHEDLAAEVDESALDVASVLSDGRVRVTLTDLAQMVPYRVVNTDPQAGRIHAYAFIAVPALGDFPPIRRPHAPALVVSAGQVLEIPLAEQIQVAPGKTPSVADVATVTATRSDGSELVKDEHTLQFRSRPDYAGPASITLRVTDATGADDPTAHSSTLTLPITVLGTTDHPPSFKPSIIDVAQGEQAVTVSLSSFTTSPTGGHDPSYTYALGGAVPDGFVASIAGDVLSVSAPASTPKGTAASLPIAIGYGGGASLSASIQLRATASSRPLASLASIELRTGVGGVASEIRVLDGAYNPFPDTPLRVLGATVIEGNGSTRVQGSQVVVQPASGFVGRIVVRVRVGDATLDAGREVDGMVTLWVRGAPGAPSQPRTSDVRDSAVTLTWDAPPDNGEPITSYQVTVRPGEATRQCPATTCTIDGLANAVEHTFTVQAFNAVGWSPASAPSAPARPDVVPDAPGEPMPVASDGALSVSWSPPASRGSPVTSYTVEITPAAPSGALVNVSEAGYTFTGLTNGVGYRVRVQAHNLMAAPGPFSAWSAVATPAGLPGAPVVSASRPGDRQVLVSWSPPGDNGAPITGYQVTIEGVETTGVGPDQHSLLWDRGENGREYTFSVVAVNTVGAGPAGTARAAVYSTPSPVQGLVVDAPLGEGRVVASWSSPADNGGRDIVDYLVDYCVDGRCEGPVRTFGATRWEHPFGGNPEVTVTVRAMNSEDGGSSPPASGSARATSRPSEPGPLTLTAQLDPTGQITGLLVQWPGSNFSGLLGMYRIEYRIDDAGPTWGEDVSGSLVQWTSPGPPGWPSSAGPAGWPTTAFTVHVSVTARSMAGESPLSYQRLDIAAPATPSPTPSPSPT